MSEQPVLVTGAAGFIGFHVARRLLQNGRYVVGVDNLNTYYDSKLKDARRAELAKFADFRFIKLDLADRTGMAALFAEHRFPHVVHLAAQAGVRHSLVDPYAYVDSNLVGFTNILEGCRHNGCRHLLFASSSSVYGSNTHMPFSVHEEDALRLAENWIKRKFAEHDCEKKGDCGIGVREAYSGMNSAFASMGAEEIDPTAPADQS